MKRQFVYKLGSAALLVLLTLGVSGCGKEEEGAIEEGPEEAPSFASVVRTSDKWAASQLASGFYGIEQNAWRWTKQDFSVVLRPPAGSAQKGGTMNLRFAVPDSHIAKLQSVVLSAAVAGQPLAPETYKTAGDFTYSRDIPANLLTGDTVKIDFHLDKVLPPQGGDRRELGVIVAGAGLAAK